MLRPVPTAVALLLAVPAVVAAQQPRTYVENGIRYQETVSQSQRPLNATRYETRETTVHQPRYTTNMQESVRTYRVPVTEQQWVLGYQRTWNIFKPPVPSYRLMPVTRWETRTEKIQVPITKLEYVPQKVVQRIPINDTRIATETVTRKVAIGVANNGTTVARKDDFSSSLQPAGDPPSASAFDGQTDRRR